MYFHYRDVTAGPPQLARPPRTGPCLDFVFQYALIRNIQSNKIGVEYWALHGSNLPWCSVASLDWNGTQMKFKGMQFEN